MRRTEEALSGLAWTLLVFPCGNGVDWVAAAGPKAIHLAWLESALQSAEPAAEDLRAYLANLGGWLPTATDSRPGGAMEALEGYFCALPSDQFRQGSDFALAAAEGITCLLNASRRHEHDANWMQAATTGGELMSMPEFMSGWAE